VQIVTHEDGCIVFDDSVTDKNFSHKIEFVRRQYSGNAHGLIKGVGAVSCVYVNPQSGEYWIIDYRIYDPDGGGNSKLNRVRDMPINAVHHKGPPFRRVLMDTWYAKKDLTLFLESPIKTTYYCPLRSNRQADDTEGKSPYRQVESLHWDAETLAHGTTIKIKGFPKHHKVKLG
ncbi:transposase, partial [Paraburkholderia aspalathi]